MSKLAVRVLIAATLSVPHAAAWATGAERSDDDLIAECVKEAQSRFFDDAAGHELTLSSREVTRGPTEDLVRIAVASGEGRTVRATCKFRGGKLFDVLR